MIHFILSQGNLTWQYRRAIATAKEHNPKEEIVLWYPWEPMSLSTKDKLNLSHITTAHVDIPLWLYDENYPAAYVYDYLALDILYNNGGAILPLDSISVGPVMDLLGDKDICVACDVPYEDFLTQSRPIDHPFNNIYIGRSGSDIVKELLDECTKRLISGVERWGDTGPGLLTVPILTNHAVATWADFPTLCGWEGSYIWKYYCGLEEPDESVRLIHLFSSAYRTLYSGVPTAVEQWVVENPDFNWVLPNKMPDILKKASWT
jgi:hypothetical protein